MKKMDIVLSLDNYTIYRNNQYFLCIPKEYNSFYHVFMSFPTKDLHNLNEEELIKEIRKIADSINAIYKNGIYVLPIIPLIHLIEAANENDDKEYNKILNNIIQPITYDIYKMFSSPQTKVSQIIKMIKQNDIDTKLIGWLSMKLSNNFIKEITFEENNQEETYNIEIPTTNHTPSSIFLEYAETNKEEKYIADSLKPATSPGFGSIGFVIMIISIFIVLGGAIIYMIIK